MSEIKNIRNATETVAEIGQNVGIVLMTAAATLGLLELPDHQNAKVTLPNQPVFARVMDSEENNNPLRREKEDTEAHYISYSVAQRTPARSGKH